LPRLCFCVRILSIESERRADFLLDSCDRSGTNTSCRVLISCWWFSRFSGFLRSFLMVLQFLRRAWRGVAAAACVLLASFVFAPSRAEASCGDYVMVGGQHGHDAPSARAGMAHHDMPDSHDPAKPRCHGPSCSNGSFPPAAPAPRVEATAEQWAFSSGSPLCQSPPTCSLLSETREVACAGFGLSILRPPR
jgi:hypothetical protein